MLYIVYIYVHIVHMTISKLIQLVNWNAVTRCLNDSNAVSRPSK